MITDYPKTNEISRATLKTDYVYFSNLLHAQNYQIQNGGVVVGICEDGEDGEYIVPSTSVQGCIAYAVIQIYGG
jgi:hypothetical protein